MIIFSSFRINTAPYIWDLMMSLPAADSLFEIKQLQQLVRTYRQRRWCAIVMLSLYAVGAICLFIWLAVGTYHEKASHNKAPYNIPDALCLGASNLNPPANIGNYGEVTTQTRSIQALQQARADCIATETLLAERIKMDRTAREESSTLVSYREWAKAFAQNFHATRCYATAFLTGAVLAAIALLIYWPKAPKTPAHIVLSIIKNLPGTTGIFFIDHRNLTQSVLRQVWADDEFEKILCRFRNEPSEVCQSASSAATDEPASTEQPTPELTGDPRFHYLLYSAIRKRRKIRSYLLLAWRKVSRCFDHIKDKESKEKQGILHLLPLTLGVAALLGLGQLFIVHRINDVREKQSETHTQLEDKLHELVLKAESTSVSHSDSSTVVTDHLVDRQHDQETIIEEQAAPHEKSDNPPPNQPTAASSLNSASSVVNIAAQPMAGPSDHPPCTEQRTELLLFFSPETPDTKARVGDSSYIFHLVQPQILGKKNNLRWPTLQGSVQFNVDPPSTPQNAPATPSVPNGAPSKAQQTANQDTSSPPDQWPFTLYYDARMQPMFNAKLQADVWVTRGSQSLLRPFGFDFLGKDVIVLHLRPRDKVSEDAPCHHDPAASTSGKDQTKAVLNPLSEHS